MNQTSHSSRPASAAEISEILRLLFDANLPFQRGANVENVAMAYIEALRGTTLEAIQAGVRKFLRGECQDVSPRYLPTPPELARIVRTAVVQTRIPEERRIAPFRHPDDGAKARMRLKMPMWQYALKRGLMDRMVRANREGFAALVTLAIEWGIPIPEEMFAIPDAEAERQWQLVRDRAWAEIERNSPPFLHRNLKHQAAKAT